MSKCGECGAFYEDKDLTCPICGSTGIAEKPVLVESIDTSEEPEENFTDQIDQLVETEQVVKTQPEPILAGEQCGELELILGEPSAVEESVVPCPEDGVQELVETENRTITQDDDIQETVSTGPENIEEQKEPETAESDTISPVEAELTKTIVLEAQVVYDGIAPESVLHELDHIEVELETQAEAVSTSEPEVPVGIAADTRAADTVVFQPDGHLGKGLVKPQVVEYEADGYHFKYDQPKQTYAKPEPVPKTVEFRVTGEEMERLADQVVAIPMESQAEPQQPADLGTVAEPAVVVNDVTIPDVADVLATEISEFATPAVPAETLPESEVPTEPVMEEHPAVEELELPEPELDLEPEPEILWVGMQTCLGFATKNGYQISNKSVCSIGAYGQKVTEVDLGAIRRLKVEQSLLARIFGVGNIAVYVEKQVNPPLVLIGIKQPGKVRQLLEDLVQGQK